MTNVKVVWITALELINLNHQTDLVNLYIFVAFLVILLDSKHDSFSFSREATTESGSVTAT